MPIKVVPFQLTEASERGSDLFELAELEAKKDVLELGAVEV
jgi:hypothetical protein